MCLCLVLMCVSFLFEMFSYVCVLRFVLVSMYVCFVLLLRLFLFPFPFMFGLVRFVWFCVVSFLCVVLWWLFCSPFVFCFAACSF